MRINAHVRTLMVHWAHARRGRGAFKIVLVRKRRRDGRQRDGGCKSDRYDFHGLAPFVWGKMNLLRARLVTQTRVILKASRITKFGVSFTQMSWSIRRTKEMIGNQPLAGRL